MLKGKGTMAELTNAIIEAAIDGFEAQKQRIDVQIAELRAMLTGAPESSAQRSFECREAGSTVGRSQQAFAGAAS